jgi:DNA primase
VRIDVSDEFQQAKQAIKLRSAIEEVVRERVPELRRAGALWVACCPFHQERTPSFKVDPRRGLWRCYGACGTGGDVISFVMTANNVDYVEALQILGARCGISLPERRGQATAKQESEPRFELMARAEQFYRRALRTSEGAGALRYLRERGLTDATIEAFGMGYAPAGATALLETARQQGVALERLVDLGLVRVDDAGRAFDFFRGRVMFPVRDDKRRTVGFGARRMSDDDPRVPKYINTPETPLFHKGRLFYALDQAIDHVRRNGHLIIVEGYTDVMAAHQVGLRSVVAVLGTATTDDHAGLVRRSGARRISLVFDGDEAGRKATVRALDGLLPLDVPIDVVRLPGDEDPCDLLVRDGAAVMERYLARATPWFDFLAAWVGELSGDERYRALDTALTLLARLRRPVARDERLADLARVLAVPAESVRAQFESLSGRRRAQREAVAPAAAEPLERDAGQGRRLSSALRGVLGASLLDPALAVHSQAFARLCVEPELARLFEVLGELHAKTLGTFAIGDVFDVLGDDPARQLVSGLIAEASAADVGARELYDQNARSIERTCLERENREHLARLRAGEEIDIEQLRALEAMRRAQFNRGQHV